jgi:hypothetical protein
VLVLASQRDGLAPVAAASVNSIPGFGTQQRDQAVESLSAVASEVFTSPHGAENDFRASGDDGPANPS